MTRVQEKFTHTVRNKKPSVERHKHCRTTSTQPFVGCPQGGRSCAGAQGAPQPKVWTRTKILSPNIRYFVANGDLWAKKVPFWVFLWQEVHYYMVCIAYFTEFNLQIWDYTQKRRIHCENCKYAFDESFHGHFCPRRKAAKFCHPGCL